MTKAVFVVRVDNFLPKLCVLTIPTIKAYADKIKADYIEITERKFPDFPPTYEKMQIYELGKNYDHCLLIDADFLIHPDAPDFTAGIFPGYVGFLDGFAADLYFELDKYFKADGRNVGLAANFVLTDQATHKLWEPLAEPWSVARTKTKREFIIDEYCLSRNLAKYKLKFTGLNYSDKIKHHFQHLGVGGDGQTGYLEKAREILELWKRG
ncbi:MAG: hypothetical protein A3B89_03655 [Candidatus Buchananbacteria bacterium RIFCSPHIGHO2_02_FULL_40_13]|nr:MAG: hypothetical protein A2820_01680 [Candidatus Buchananbacteria bacterium RIFCSPHIGHO2_01_FULL_40_35]OGY50299.1 MAG: hypothetical protein A3B89_03655 [Candidatus Buchananbacteria bacterium RIFCSPHIGHO2_02_FULL_40_13]